MYLVSIVNGFHGERNDGRSPYYNWHHIAAKDAHVGIELFKFFAGKLQSEDSQEYCVKRFDTAYLSGSKYPNQMNNQQPKKKKNKKSNKNKN